MYTMHNYHLHQKRGYLIAVNHDKPLCPICKKEMKVRDSYKRKVKDASGTPHYFRLRRLFCANCQRIHAEIPDIITAFRQYNTETIKGVISGDLDNFTGDYSTVYRWKHT